MKIIRKRILLLAIFLMYLMHYLYAQESPDVQFKELFIDVQMGEIFKDSKTFVDCIPIYSPKKILKKYERQKKSDDFKLKRFVSENFRIPSYDSILNSDEYRDIYDAKNKLLKFNNGLKDFGRLINIGLKSSKYYEGLVFQGSAYEGIICSFIEFLHINGGQIFYEDGKVQLDTKVDETIIFIRNGIYTEKFIPPSIFGYDEGESRDSFYNEYSVMLRNWPFILQMYEGELCKNVGILKINGAKPVLGGWYLAIPKRSEHPKEAWELIKYLTDTNSQRLRAMQTDVSKRRLPSDYEALKMIKEEKPSWIWLEDVEKAIENADPRPQIPHYMLFSKIFSKYLYRILSNSRIKDEEIPKKTKECQESINREISAYSDQFVH